MTIKWVSQFAIHHRLSTSVHDYEKQWDHARWDNDADATSKHGG